MEVPHLCKRGRGKATERQYAGRPLRSCCPSRTARARPRRPARATVACLARYPLITTWANFARNACGATNTEAMRALGTSLASYAKQALFTLRPLRALRPCVTTFALDPSRSGQASGSQHPRHGLNDDLNRP